MKLSVIRTQPKKTLVIVVTTFFTLLVYSTSWPKAVTTGQAEGPRTEKGPRSKWSPGPKNTSSENGTPGSLLINTRGYQLPLLQPWDASIRRFLKKALDPSKDLACSKGIPEVSRSEGNKVILKMDLLRRHPKAKCCYATITRVEQSPSNYSRKADSLYRLEKRCHLLQKAATVIHAPAVYIKCISGKKLVYKNVHHLVDLRPLEKKVEWRKRRGCDQGSCISEDETQVVSKKGKPKKTERDSDVRSGWEMVAGRLPSSARSDTRAGSDNDPYSVVIFGVDSVSRQNLQRYMPKTFEFLKRSGVVDLQGFNKVADNTFPNLMPILAGKSGVEVSKECLGGNRWKAFDNCSLIWKNFSSHGYVTVYGEDAPLMGLFHYKHTGFVKQPTDLYLRHSLLASDVFVGHDGKLKPKNHFGNYCQGPLSCFDVIRRYSIDVANTLSHLPYFAFFWTSKTTHSLNYFASLVDLGALEYLKRVRSHPTFARTFVFFMSDHGLRFGNIRTTTIGKLEERLPFMYVLVPSDFKMKFPVAYRNLVMNQKRLTSHYDIHTTLWDILQMAYRRRTYVEQGNVISKSFPGLSLFRSIPDTRTCKDAGIPAHYCAGLLVHPTEVNDEVVEAAVRFVVQKLNKDLEKFPRCSQFTGHKIRKAETTTGRETILQLQFQVVPGKGLMEATVEKKGRSFQMVADVSRINSYHGQSDCIDDESYKKYCFCK